MGRAVPQPSLGVVSYLSCCGRRMDGLEEGGAYLDNLIATNKLVDILPRTAVEEDTREIDRALPRLEASFVDAGADVGVGEVVESFVVRCFVFGHELHADIGQVAAWQVDYFARG